MITTLIKKELRQYFSGLLGYITIGIFLLASGVFLFVLPDSNIFDAGYATLDSFFSFAPYIMLFLIPAITMKSISEEYRAGTFEILSVAPLKKRDLVFAKFLAAFLIAFLAILFTFIYVVSIAALSTGGIDLGGVIGSYIGLIMLCAVYTSIGIYTSSLQQNVVVSFLLSALLCYVIYALFSSVAGMPFLRSGFGYFISLLGIRNHYENMSKGFIDSRDLIYFISVISIFLFLTIEKIKSY